jgi:hypothetical protein
MYSLALILSACGRWLFVLDFGCDVLVSARLAGAVMSRSACHFHVLHKDDLDKLRAKIPVLNSMMNKVSCARLQSYRIRFACCYAPNRRNEA